MGDPRHGSESENDDLVEPVTFKNTHQSDESSATAWDFGSRLQGRPSSSIGGRQLPTRHASLDAGYLQQRVYAAAHVLDRSDAPAQTGPGVPKPNKSRIPHAASHNEGIEIAWVWPPCLANDTGPVEFAVNVAPREWLNGKHSHRRVPCWPVSGLCLHITFGEQLLQVQELDICGTTKVRLQLPPALTSPHLNFITVMLVDHGKVGPATQLLTMPSSAADEFSGLFRILVEHEMLPHTAAHPEYVSMLFGSSGCSSGSTAHSCNSFRGLNSSIHSGGAAAAVAAAAAAGGKGLASPSVGAAGPSATNPAAAAAALAGVNGSILQQQLLLQGHLHRQQRRLSHKARRHSAGYVQVSGTPAVVQRWSSAAVNSSNQLRLTADAGSMLPTGGQAGLTNLHGSSSSNQLVSATADKRMGRIRRASANDVHFATTAFEGTSCDDSSSRTLTTIDGSFSATSESRVLQLLASVPCVSQQQVLDLGSEQQEGQQQLQEQEPEASGQLSVCSSGGLPRYSEWEVALAADATPAALLLIGDDEDADELHPVQAATVAAARSSIAGAGAAVSAQQQRQQHQKQMPAEGAAEPEGRKSLSLDRCAVHVHNEVERAQRTRSRMSLDEGNLPRSRMSLDEGNRGSGGQLHMPSALMSATAGPAAASHPTSTAAAAAAANTSFAVAASPIDSMGISNGRDAAAAAAAAAAALLLQAAAAPPAVAQPAVSAAALGRAGAGATAHAEQPAPYPGPAAASSLGLQAGHEDASAAASIAHAAAAAPRLFGSSRGLERRTAAEANMSAAFTTAWTCHMLELASDLQYLVVCVPSAFASNLETWFGRIIGSRGPTTISSGTNRPGAAGAAIASAGGAATGLSGVGSGGGFGGGSGGLPGSSAKPSESSWDSTMYMKRLGQVLDTLQEHNMWTTMSLLLQHCSLGGLDLYPAGCLHQHLQQQQQQQQELPRSQLQLQGPLDPSALTPHYLEHLGSLDVGSASCWVRPVPTIINTQLPCMPRAAAAAPGGSSSTSSSGTFGFSISPYGRMGMQSAREMYLQATGGSRRGTTSIDVTPADLAEARAAAADARAAASMWPSQQAAAGGRSSIGSSSSRRQHRQQQDGQRQHRGPRRSLSWPLGVLYSAFSWAQTAQLRHKQRSFWQRAWGLHSLPEGSERGSESSAASSMDASSFRSSSSTQRSSTVTSLDDAAPWARRVSAGLGRLAGGPAAAVAAAAAAAAGGHGRQQQQQQLMQDAARRSSVGNAEGIRARSSYSAVPGRRSNAAAESSSSLTAAAAVGSVSRSYDASGVHAAAAAGGGGGGVSDASAARDRNVAQRIAALQNSLLAQAALPPEKVERLKAAVQAKAQKPAQGQQQQQQGPQEVQQQQQVQLQAGSKATGDADRTSSAAAGVTADAAAAVEGSAAEQQLEQQQLLEAAIGPVQRPNQAVSLDVDTAPGPQQRRQQQKQEHEHVADADAVASEAVPVQHQHQQPPQAPDATAAVAAAAAAVAVAAATGTKEEGHAGSSSSSTAPASAVDVRPQAAVAAGSRDATLGDQSPAGSCTDVELLCSPTKANLSQQRRAAAADAADQKAAVVAAALTVVGVVEQCTSQLLMTLMVPYCLCFLPSILPGLQPPHLVAAMGRRPAWLEGLLLLLISIHWFAVTNVSIVRPSSQRPRNSLEAYRAAVAALRAANAVLAASEAAGELDDAGAAAGGLDVRRQRRREEHKLRKLRDRQQRLLGRAVVSSAVAVAALGLVIYSLLVFVSAWVDLVLGDGASVVWVYRGWNELQQHLDGGG